METRASKYLKRKQVPFNTVEYKHEQKGAEFAAHAIGFALEKTVKTLMLIMKPEDILLASDGICADLIQ